MAAFRPEPFAPYRSLANLAFPAAASIWRRAAVGSFEFVHWNADIDNPANKRFVADYTKKYGYPPSAYSDQGYDSAQGCGTSFFWAPAPAAT